MKRRFFKLTSLLLTLCLLLPLSSCGKAEEGYSLIFGDPNAKDVLRICVDIDFREINETNMVQQRAITDFMSLLQQYGEFENVVFQAIPSPSSSSERSVVLSRLRTEIMAGKGPDVFILQCISGLDFAESLITYPQKAMENGIFLPLDTYMENNTEYTEWDAQEQAVLAAGRNKEGQQVIPLAYTLPLQTYHPSNAEIEFPDKLLTWNDMLTDPALKEHYKDFVDCIDVEFLEQPNGEIQKTYSIKKYLPYIIGNIADFEKEELLFTEEELMQRVTEILEMADAAEAAASEDNKEPTFFRQHQLSQSICSGVSTFVMPLYSDDGGVTAEITHFAAVNRNTKHPEKAYKVIDILLSEEAQMKSKLYVSGICEFANTSPVHGNTFHPDTALNGTYYMPDEASFETLEAVREQITAVNFESELTADLTELLWECRSATYATPEELVNHIYGTMKRRLIE